MGYTTYRADNIAALSETSITNGDVNEWIANDGTVTIYAVASASGLKLTVYADQDLVVDRKELVSIGTTLSKFDHEFVSFEASAGTRILIKVSETSNVSTNDILVGLETPN